jgi:hypothetical protein
MEQAVQALSLSTATEPITADSDADPYKMFQVHDYKGVSFLRQAPQVKTASTETIKVFATAYPELLKEKFFVNVPALMGFMYGFIKLFVAARTIVSSLLTAFLISPQTAFPPFICSLSVCSYPWVLSLTFVSVEKVSPHV